MGVEIPLEKIDDYRWRIPKAYKPGMRVPGVIYADRKMLAQILSDNAPEQVVNVAFLPGIVKYSLAMPDIHWGYGFCIGGVAAMDPAAGGVISPGGIGYDINCGVRLMRTDLEYKDVHPHIDKLVYSLFRDIPCGVGQKGEIRINTAELKRLVTRGSAWAVARGYGDDQDIEFTEQRGCLEGAVPDTLTTRALQRGLGQSGTLGSGNHFLEVQLVEHIYEPEVAEVFGLFKGQITVMIHSGSRGFGYQVCDDSLRYMGPAPARYGFSIPDRQLACAPVFSPEGKRYYAEMCCAANYAWVNRQVLMHLCRRVFADIFGRSYSAMAMRLVYDVAHNIGKFEKYRINGIIKELFVHRKGATRAFAPGHPDLPAGYRDSGQPVIIPGDMGRNSYVMVGTEKAMTDTFGSICHGAGRVMSRSKAIRTLDYQHILKQLKDKDVVVMSKGKKGLLEEAPDAYKDVNDVVRIVHNAGIAKMVARMKPLGVIKG